MSPDRAPAGPDTPAVLLLAFRRPEPTARVVAAIRDARPQRLWVALDGPRPEVAGEADLVAETRAVIARAIDWPCEVRWRERPQNLGCRRGVVDAIDWFLGEAGEGIILEDDCVPHPDLFRYCAELLDRYRDDERVWCVSGDNSARITLAGTASYGFVGSPQIWGWATWARAWAHYDRDLEAWAAVRGTPAVRRLLPDPIEREVTVRLLDRLRDEGEPDTWDYQWLASCLMGGGLCAVPRTNLVTNVGFGPDATHTRERNRRAEVAAGPILPLIHPRAVVRDRRAERELFDRTKGGARLRAERSRVVRLRRAIGRVARAIVGRPAGAGPGTREAPQSTGPSSAR